MKKFLFKVNFITRAYIQGKEHEQQGTRLVLVEAENNNAASDTIYESMKKASCCFQVEEVPSENLNIYRVYDAMDNFSSALDELSNAWTELDEHIPIEEDLVDKLNNCFPKDAISLSLDDFAVVIKEWNRKVQGIY